MPIFTVVNPDIPAESKDKFLAAWPTLNAEVKSQPGVAGVMAGRVVAEDGKELVDEFKWVECLAFKTIEDFESFAGSAWSQEQKAKYVAARGAEPKVGRFEVADFPVSATGPTPYIQFSTMILDDESKAEEAKEAWIKLSTALGKEAWGGKSVGDGPTVGLALVGWDSLEDTIAAFQKPEAAAALAAYKALGNNRNALVKIE